MHDFINSPFQIGALTLNNRLIQGPLAGYSCAPFRQLVYDFTPPAFCVSEMVSAHDVLHKHTPASRYIYRAPQEKRLAYQLAGTDPTLMAMAAIKLEALGADLIDVNCGCPKAKIRKKGAGSALLEDPLRLVAIIHAIRERINIPLTIKIRIQGNEQDIALARQIEQAGADALIVHGRRWTDDYDIPCDFQHIGRIKHALRIPVIANGDIACADSLAKAIDLSQCDAYMISRAGCGHPWLYQELLQQTSPPSHGSRIDIFLNHLQGLARLESEHKAILQSKSLIRYYFKHRLSQDDLQLLYTLNHLQAIKQKLLSLGAMQP
jgi:tRNA-dihydrouridine synthase B